MELQLSQIQFKVLSFLKRKLINDCRFERSSFFYIESHESGKEATTLSCFLKNVLRKGSVHLTFAIILALIISERVYHPTKTLMKFEQMLLQFPSVAYLIV